MSHCLLDLEKANTQLNLIELGCYHFVESFKNLTKPVSIITKGYHVILLTKRRFEDKSRSEQK